VTSRGGLRAKLSRPLDWLVISDHAEMYGLMPQYLVERSMIISPGHTLVINDNLLPIPSSPASTDTIKDLAANERDHIQQVLDLTNWRIEGPAGAAALLDIHPSTLRFRLKKLGLRRPS